MVAEEWKHNFEYPKYEVSSLGKVRRISTGHILSQFITSKGYPAVYVMGPFKSGPKQVAVMVMRTFNERWPKDFKTVIRYRDGNKLNCCFDNLYYATASSVIKEGWLKNKFTHNDGRFLFNSETAKLARAGKKILSAD